MSGTPDRFVDDARGTPDVNVGEGDILTGAEHDARSHSGVPGTGSLTPGDRSSGWTEDAVPFAKADGTLDEKVAGFAFDPDTDRLSVAGSVRVASGAALLDSSGLAFAAGATVRVGPTDGQQMVLQQGGSDVIQLRNASAQVHFARDPTPTADGGKNLGTSGSRWGTLHLLNALNVGGTKVIGAQHPAITKLTDNTGESANADKTLVDVNGVGSVSVEAVERNFADLAAAVNEIFDLLDGTTGSHALMA